MLLFSAISSLRQIGSGGISALTSCKTSVPPLFSWLPQSTLISKRTPGGLRFHGTLAHLLIRSRQSQDSAHCVDTSANCKCGVHHLGSLELRAHNSHASSLDRGLRTAPFSVGRTSPTAAFRLRHPSCSLTVRISLQRPTFDTIPSLRIPEPVKAEPPHGSSPSPSGNVWN